MIQKIFSTPIYPIFDENISKEVRNLERIGINNITFLLDDGVEVDYDESKIEIKTMLGKKVIYDVSLGIPMYVIELNLSSTPESIQVKPFRLGHGEPEIIANFPLEDSIDYLLSYYGL